MKKLISDLMICMLFGIVIGVLLSVVAKSIFSTEEPKDNKITKTQIEDLASRTDTIKSRINVKSDLVTAYLENIQNDISDETNNLDDRLDRIEEEIYILEEKIDSLTTTEELTEETSEEPVAEKEEVYSTIISSAEIVKSENGQVKQITDDNIVENKEYLGVYELTAYIPSGNPCANGNYPTAGYTVACNSLPMGTRIYIEGWGEYVVEDRGGMADNVIDIFVNTYDEAINIGRQTANVYLVR